MSHFRTCLASLRCPNAVFRACCSKLARILRQHLQHYGIILLFYHRVNIASPAGIGMDLAFGLGGVGGLGWAGVGLGLRVGFGLFRWVSASGGFRGFGVGLRTIF